MTTTEDMTAGFVHVRPNVVAVFPIGSETWADTAARARRDWRGRGTAVALVDRAQAAKLAQRGR
jgi:hypothetical protein